MFYLYIIYSKSLDKYYVGHSSDIIERIERHNRGGEKYTSIGQPWILVYSELYPSKEAAYKREREIKKWKSKKMIEKLIAKAR